MRIRVPFLRRQEWMWLGLCVVVGLTLRLWRINTDLLIHFDQGLHAYGAWQWWHERSFKLLGHMTDTDGINHGPYYYMLLAIPYGVSGGDPVAAIVFLIFLEMLSFVFLYLALRNFFSQRLAMATILVVSVSYGAVYFSRWLSNVTPILPLTNLGLFLASLRNSDLRRSVALGMVAGLVAQMNGAVGFVFVPSILVLAGIRGRQVLMYLGAVGLVQIPLLLFELRHDFVMSRAILRFATQSEGGYAQAGAAFWPTIVSFLRQNEFYLARGLFITSAALLALGVFRLVKERKTRLLFYLLFGLVTFGMMGRGGLGFFFSYCFAIMTATCLCGLESLGKRSFILICFGFVFLNVIKLGELASPSNGLTPIGTNSLITVADRKAVVDFIYKEAAGESFSLWIYTIPYHLDQPWNYFFDWHGQSRYGYLPERTGSFSPGDLKDSRRVFVIYEPDVDQPMRLEWWLGEVESNFGGVRKSFRSNDAIVELRSYGEKE